METRSSTPAEAGDVAELAKRKPWSKEEAGAVLEGWQKSGMPLETYAQRCGLVPQRLRWWCKKLGGATGQSQAKPVSFAPVRVVERRTGAEVPPEPVRKESTQAGAQGGTGVEVVMPGGVRIQVGRDFDAATLKRLLEMMEARPC